MSKILVTSTQYPYYGGAATNSYALIKYLRSHGHDVAGIFFENKNVNVDPDKIRGVWRFNYKTGNKNYIKRIISRYLDGVPQIVLGKNYAAPVMSKSLFPKSKIVYLVTGSPQMTPLSQKGISYRRHLKAGSGIIHKQEDICIKASDIIVPNSPQARRMLVKNYGPNSKFYKPIDTSLAFNRSIKPGKPFEHRDYDIAFVCSNLSRTVKNSRLALDIFSKSMHNNRKIIIGNNSDSFSSIRNTTVKSLLSQSEVIRIMQNTRVVICTSYYDASPNVIKEAIMCGANILTSKNCGWSSTYPTEFVCNDVYNINEWISKLSYLSKNKIDHSIKFDSEKLIIKINRLL